MVQIVKIVLGLLYWIAIVVFYVKGKVKWPTFLSIITLSVYPLILGLIFIYALPKNVIHGKVMAELPIAVALILVAISIFSLKAPKTPSNIFQNNPSKIRWFFLLSGIVVYMLGIIITLEFFYVPRVFGQTAPMPHYGVTTNLICGFISSVLLYLASKKGSAKRPNLLRHISFVFIFLVFSQLTLVISLILIYSFPTQPLTSYPTLASLNMLCYLFFGMLLVLMRREYVVVDTKK
jgi:hypothetical protein